MDSCTDRTLELLIAAQAELKRVIRYHLQNRVADTMASWGIWRNILKKLCQLHVGQHGDLVGFILLLRHQSSKQTATGVEWADLLVYCRCMKAMVKLHRLQCESRDYFKALLEGSVGSITDGLNLAAELQDVDLYRQELDDIVWSKVSAAHLIHAINAAPSAFPVAEYDALYALLFELHSDDPKVKKIKEVRKYNG